MLRSLTLVVLAFGFAGCGGGFKDTLLRDPEARLDAPIELAVDVPERYEVLASEYQTAYVNTSSGDESADIQGRSTLTLRVRDRATGELALLIYEDLRRRARPTTILRLRTVPDR